MQVRENPLDHDRILEARDHLKPRAARRQVSGGARRRFR
jgi:hypothetical protein